ncbi:PTS ascorbate transporter subunit IIC [Dickeya lacustris]|uniref:Ascorbate-specific PTS system EIIC component n=1 Tax=Dickeya lacustris TaxID=2259638 RepID=A0ABY8G818_9GAMM|nr:PTS ascorbate transporter subunit IIC [Dickeya lacustris]WFN56054.1 PTS ascorbate transporter subunit IIC [Dickeya lacustris]
MDILLSLVKTPAVIIAIVAFLGLLFQRAPLSRLITGTFLSFIGFTMIKVGGSILMKVLTAFSSLFSHAFHIAGVVPSNEAIMAATLDKVGATAALILLFAMLVNILLARFTRLKYIYLSLHLVLFMAFAFTAVLMPFHLTHTTMVALSSLLIGLYMAASPYILSHFSRRIIGSNEYAISHAAISSYVLGSYLGKWFGNKTRDTEQLALSQRVDFLREPNVATLLTMLVLLLLSCLFATRPQIHEAMTMVYGAGAADKNAVIFILEQAATFACGLYLAKAGVNLFTAEIVPAFKGFANVFAPGAVPAVDVMVLFTKAPNATLIGFLVSFSVELVCILLFPLVGLPIIVPGIMASFITGGAAAIFGNATGGVRGAILASSVNGLLLCVLPALTLPLFSHLGAQGVTFADPDFTLPSLLLDGILRLFR